MNRPKVTQAMSHPHSTWTTFGEGEGCDVYGPYKILRIYMRSGGEGGGGSEIFEAPNIHYRQTHTTGSAYCIDLILDARHALNCLKLDFEK